MSPLGVVPQQDRRLPWICDYSSQVYDEMLTLAATEAMQFGYALDYILEEIPLANPAYALFSCPNMASLSRQSS